MSDRFWFLKNCELFETLTDDQLGDLESVSRVRDFPRKSLIYLPSDTSGAALLLLSGRVKLYHVTGEGKQAVLGFINASSPKLSPLLTV